MTDCATFKTQMDEQLAILLPSEQYFSHFRMMGGDDERLCEMADLSKYLP